MAMGAGEIWTWSEGSWHQGDVRVAGAADHGLWQGTGVFDGGRGFEGVAPDMDLHCARVNESARAMGLDPMHSDGELTELSLEGLGKFPAGAEVYVRPMYWSREGDETAVLGNPESTAFALCLEEAAMGAPTGFSVTTTHYTRPTLATNLTNCKASCLYPNNARMIAEARAKA